jgi:hypothetical protein
MKGRILLLVATFGLITALALPASAQSSQQDHRSGWQDRDHDDHDRDHDQDRYRDRKAYQDGLRDGQHDRGRSAHPRGDEWRGEDHDAYSAGYRAGFAQAVDRDHDRDHDRDGGHGGNQAYRNGYEQGMSYGQHDSRARKPSRPTDSNVYQNGTYGFNKNYGHVDDYKRDFRQGYQDGYMRGYNGR